MTNHSVPSPYTDRLSVKPEWLDGNGHMNVAFYLQAFDDGGEVFFGDVGIGWDYTKLGQGTLFIASSNLDFRRELFAGDELLVTTQLIDWNPKLVHAYQAIYHHASDELAATAEMLYVHIDFATRKSAPMPTTAQEKLNAIKAVHKDLPRPENLGRGIGIRR